MINYIYQLKNFSSKIDSSSLNKMRSTYFNVCKAPNIKTPIIKTIYDNFFRNATVLRWQQEISSVPPQNEILHCRLSLCHLYIDGLKRSHFVLCRSGKHTSDSSE